MWYYFDNIVKPAKTLRFFISLTVKTFSSGVSVHLQLRSTPSTYSTRITVRIVTGRGTRQKGIMMSDNPFWAFQCRVYFTRPSLDFVWRICKKQLSTALLGDQMSLLLQILTVWYSPSSPTYLLGYAASIAAASQHTFSNGRPCYGGGAPNSTREDNQHTTGADSKIA